MEHWTSLNSLHSHGACQDGYDKIRASLPPGTQDFDVIPMLKICDVFGPEVDETLWCLRTDLCWRPLPMIQEVSGALSLEILDLFNGLSTDYVTSFGLNLNTTLARKAHRLNEKIFLGEINPSSGYSGLGYFYEELRRVWDLLRNHHRWEKKLQERMATPERVQVEKSLEAILHLISISFEAQEGTINQRFWQPYEIGKLVRQVLGKEDDQEFKAKQAKMVKDIIAKREAQCE